MVPARRAYEVSGPNIPNGARNALTSEDNNSKRLATSAAAGAPGQGRRLQVLQGRPPQLQGRYCWSANTPGAERSSCCRGAHCCRVTT